MWLKRDDGSVVMFSAGAFPSHCEGFPFGVLEMLAAGLPVVAYRAPGAPMMIGGQERAKPLGQVQQHRAGFEYPRGRLRALVEQRRLDLEAKEMG